MRTDRIAAPVLSVAPRAALAKAFAMAAPLSALLKGPSGSAAAASPPPAGQQRAVGQHCVVACRDGTQRVHVPVSTAALYRLTLRRRSYSRAVGIAVVIYALLGGVNIAAAASCVTAAGTAVLTGCRRTAVAA